MLVATNNQQTAQSSPKTTRANTPIKMERRDSSSSYSSLEDLQNEKRKLNAITSTPVVTSEAAISCNVNVKAVTTTNQLSDAIEQQHSLQNQMQESDEANDYDEDESADEKSTQPHLQLHYKRRLSSRSLSDKATSYQVEYNANNPNSLRKKFRANRFVLNTGDESGFVDASNNSQSVNMTSTTSLTVTATNDAKSNENIKSNSSSDTSSPPQSNGNSSPESGIGEREDMKYMCPICDVVSQTAHQFTNHIRCHNYASGHTENFTCRICSKVLSSASSLDRHVLVHTGERPFNCKYCHLTFTTNGNMHRHMRTHKQHQHTHHRRNSNGTKFNTSNSNNNNSNNNYNNYNSNNINNNNNKISTTSIINKTTLSNGQLCEGVKLLTTADTKPTTTTTAIATATATAIATSLSSSPAALNTTANASDNNCNQKATGANGERLNGNANLESYESDGGCSSDSSAGHGNNSHNNNNNNNNNEKPINNSNNNNNNNNNNDFKINNNNYKRKHSDDQPLQDTLDSKECNYNLLKRRLRPETTHSPSNADNNIDMVDDTLNDTLVCPICNENNFLDDLALDQHIDSKHPKIPAKCKHCGVIYLTQHQFNIHVCPADIKSSINLSMKQRRLSENSNHQSEEEHDEMEESARQGNELLHHFKNVMTHSQSSNQEIHEDDIKSEPSAHDSKDLADIQSILNMTASSSNSNLLKNFEQSVNTPSSQYSYDRDEEEAQDAFTSEFRKMKLRGEFPCKLCPAVYPNLRALKGHNRVHLSEAGPAGPFRCNMCPYSICDKAALIRHMRTHNGDRPYECAVCNYAFTTKANCERHLRNRHAKTTREEVKRAIIYHPSEDSSCEDTTKKMQLFSSELEEDCDLMPYHQHQPKDRSTPVSHLKERLTSGDSPSSKPVKIQVKSLDDLLDKSTTSSGYHDTYDKRNIDISQTPIDMSMDVLDLSKKPSVPPPPVQEEKVESSIPLLSLPKADENPSGEIIKNKIISMDTDPKLDITNLDKQHQQLLLAQQQLLSDPNQLMQQLYRNLLFPQFPPFFMPSTFMNTNFSDFQKLAPILTRMMGGVAAATLPNTDIEKPSNLTPLNTNNSSSTPQLSPLISEKSNSATLTRMSSPKSLLSPNPNHLAMPRHIMPPTSTPHSPNLPPTMLSNAPVKMVLKNGVFMPKQKQRRYRTERPFACEHCSARFTLRSNMERHVKQQHPQFYAQRQRSGHHVMRGRGASNATNISSMSHFQAVTQGHYGSAQPPVTAHSPISEQVKCAILAQQLKARKDTDLLHQALAHGSNSVINSNMFPQQAPSLNNGQSPFFSFHPNHNHHISHNGTPNGSMEDDEPKLIIDEDDEEEDDEEDLEDIPDEHEDLEGSDLVLNHNEIKQEARNLPTIVEEPKLQPKEPQEAAKKVAESILEQAIKAKQKISSFNNTLDSSSSNNTMKSMIAQAPAVGKFLKEVASSSFKDESQDLVSVSELVDNATNNSMSFNSYFRPSDVANHMEPSDEDGLVASSASESNNSGAEDTVSTEKPKKKSAYSLAPNRVHCPYCQRMFPWSSSLRRHILTHTGQKPFKCSHCPLLFTTKSNCDRHLLRKHGDVESAVSVYVPTEDVSEPIPLPKSVEEIERMQREREEEERKRKAEEQRERLQKEQMEKQKFEQEQQKQAFLKQLAVAQFQHQFTQKPDISPVSSSELPYKCHLCENSFSERLQCLEHIKSQHAQEFALLLSKGAIENETDSVQMASNEEDERQRNTEDATKGGKYPDYSNRKVICAFCMRRFWSTEDLRRHMRTHSGERPFQCEICFRKFTLKHSMLRHMKKHNGLHINGSQSNGESLANTNSGSDYSDDEQTSNSVPTPTLPIPNANFNALLMGSKFQELLSKANEWRNCSLNALRGGKENNSEETNTPQSSDLIGNLLGISDQGIINKLMSSPDEAAKFLGVEK